MAYFVETRRSGAAFAARDLKGIDSDDPSEALRSVTGYELPRGSLLAEHCSKA